MTDELTQALADNRVRDLVTYYQNKAAETLNTEESLRYRATAFYLSAYSQLPFHG